MDKPLLLSPIKPTRTKENASHLNAVATTSAKIESKNAPTTKNVKISLQQLNITSDYKMTVTQAALLMYPEFKYRPPGYYLIMDTDTQKNMVHEEVDRQSTTSEKTEIYWPLNSNITPFAQTKDHQSYHL